MELQEIVDFIKAEPEFEGELPDSIYFVMREIILMNDKGLAAEFLRAVVRSTKGSMINRLLNPEN
jgi:hypothetical protein